MPVHDIEVLQFISTVDAASIRQVGGGSRAAVATGLVALHFTPSHGQSIISDLGSREKQTLHLKVKELLKPIGEFRVDEYAVDALTGKADLMAASDLPFVLLACVAESVEALPDVMRRAAGRPVETAHVSSETRGWHLRVWPDLALICAARDKVRVPYKLARHELGVPLSVMLDATLVRLAQRELLESLARRAANGAAVESGDVRSLYEVATRTRSKLWWPHVSTEPVVASLADTLSGLWGLPDLASSAESELGGLARQAELRADRTLAWLLFLLTLGAVALTLGTLAVAVIDSGHVAVAALGAVASLLLVGAVGALLFYTRLRTLLR